jgi:Uma2 family endonuclease
MSTPDADYITPAEYLEIERKAETKSEYIDGRMYAMSGASEPHNVITLNIASELRTQMRGRPYSAYMADMRVKAGRTELYPDVIAVYGERHFEDAHVDIVLNPKVIIEVLSDFTEKYDRGEKFGYYEDLESLREYVLVSQHAVEIEHFVHDGSGWLFSRIKSREGRLTFPSIGCEVAVSDIYENVELS